MADAYGLYRGHRAASHPSGSEASSWAEIQCGHCSTQVSAAVISRVTNDTGHASVEYLQCPTCGLGSVRNPDGRVSPSMPYGPRVEGLPISVASAYAEARSCMAVGAHRAAELLCRNILMNVAVEKGASPGESFSAYVDFLATSGYVTPPMKPWVDQIRKHGNKAGHNLDEVTRERAEETMWFTSTLLTLTYETEHRQKKYAPAATPAKAAIPAKPESDGS